MQKMNAHELRKYTGKPEIAPYDFRMRAADRALLMNGKIKHAVGFIALAVWSGSGFQAIV